LNSDVQRKDLLMADRTSPDTRGTGLAVGRLLVAAGLVVAGLFAGPAVAAADTTHVVASSGDVSAEWPAFDIQTGSRIG
jgi:hypothetical protein